jgi:hypothetical protein
LDRRSANADLPAFIGQGIDATQVRISGVDRLRDFLGRHRQAATGWVGDEVYDFGTDASRIEISPPEVDHTDARDRENDHIWKIDAAQPPPGPVVVAHLDDLLQELSGDYSTDAESNGGLPQFLGSGDKFWVLRIIDHCT